MKDTSTLKKEFEKILKVKRTSGILVELLFVSLSLALSIKGNKSDYVTIIGTFSTLFVIYNARIINIDQLLFENKAAYLAIDKLFIQLEYSIDDEDEVRNISELYQNALENVENIPGFIFQKKQKKVFACIKAYVKLLFFVWFEYIIEIFVMFILALFAIYK